MNTQRRRAYPFTFFLFLTFLAVSLTGCGQYVMATKLNDFEVEFEKRLQVVKEDLFNGKVQMNYQDQIDVKGGVPPYKWELLEGRLPDGLTLDSLTGWITGIPTASGKQVFVVRAYDSSNDVARGFVIRSFVLKVE